MPSNFWLLLCLGIAVAGGECAAADDELRVLPGKLSLDGPHASAQIVVLELRDGAWRDVTRESRWANDSSLVRIDDRGLVLPITDGAGVIRLTVGERTAELPVEVKRRSNPALLDFERDVQPIMTRFACNSGPCHGKQRGQNGFQLSLLGFDNDFDFDSLTKEARGRRIFPPVPEQSLLLQKPLGEVPHGGGKRLSPESPDTDVLRRWIREGATRSVAGTPALVSVSVEPPDLVLLRKTSYQLRVTAKYSDGSEQDVTRLASYQSNEAPVVAVDERGLMTAGGALGDTAVMARYLGQLAVCNVVVPHPDAIAPDVFAALPRTSAIDGLVWDRLQKLRVTPSAPAEEHTVLRRLYLDLIGRGPTAAEARTYLEDATADKRQRKIDELLDHPEFAEHWANKWTDLLRPNPYRVGIKATHAFDTWIRDSFRKDKPYDQFVRELLTARGSSFRDGATVLFRDRRSPDELTTIVSQLFLGIRLECAKCHHHPFEVYGQQDFYSFAAYFAKVGRKGTGISTPISGSEEFIFAGTSGSVAHPLTGAVLPPKPLYGAAVEPVEGQDLREALAAWVTSPDNHYFRWAIANRVWADLMGRGLVEPVDDLRATNPPSNPALLEELSRHLQRNGFRLKSLVRSIAMSNVYALSSLPSERNTADYRNFSRHYRQRLRAEVLYDTLSSVLDVEEDFSAAPLGTRAKELWTVRVDSLFLDAFGRQDPNQDPPCERNSDATIVQALHLMNSEELQRRLGKDGGRPAALAASDKTPPELVDEIYLTVYGRFPAEDERQGAATLLGVAAEQRRQAVEDLFWALINTPEFVFED